MLSNYKVMLVVLLYHDKHMRKKRGGGGGVSAFPVRKLLRQTLIFKTAATFSNTSIF